MDVRATVTHEDTVNDRPWWVATVDDADGGGATQARRLDKLVDAIAEMVIVRHDLAEDTEVTVTLDFSGVPDLADAVAATLEADAAAEAAAAQVAQARRNLARATSHLTVRDLAVALGVSHQTAARIRREANVA
jgi:nucleoside-diphosphate-sugar epimerase